MVRSFFLFLFGVLFGLVWFFAALPSQHVKEMERFLSLSVYLVLPPSALWVYCQSSGAVHSWAVSAICYAATFQFLRKTRNIQEVCMTGLLFFTLSDQNSVNHPVMDGYLNSLPSQTQILPRH